MLMLWLYVCMWLLFFGAEINVWLKEPESFGLTEKESVLK